MKGRFSVLLLIPLAFGVWYLTGMLKHAHAPVTSGSGIPVITSSVVSTAIAYERKQLGCPYVYGADGPCSKGFDCSSLVQQAYRAAGVDIFRTSQQQWAELRHVATPRIGDLVFFAGSDGTPTAPGHVGIILDPLHHLMIDAYAAGTYVREETYGKSTSAPGLSIVVGFAVP